ncbi:MAG: Serine-type D-Ala-D-Ala carboxypeptidase [Parcubacteria group bacterium GW2011_GWA2_47_21]|nr:MAG: Serine-type D-Ala-D-Ala carboxypeptidase [Parcubacteria group bacterium GW2011_GWA2_47_21]
MDASSEQLNNPENPNQEKEAENAPAGSNQNTVGIAAVVLALALFGIFTFHIDLNQKSENTRAAFQRGGMDNLKFPADRRMIDAFQGLQLEAKSVAIFDLQSGEFVYEKNATAQLPLASLTKIMTAIVAKESISNPTIVTIEKDDITQDGDSGLKIGEEWNLYDLIKFMLVSSSNDGASALATAIGASADGLAKPETEGEIASSKESFIEKMNGKAVELGLDQTFFLNESGLDETEGLSGAYGSARDVAKLLAYAIIKHPDIMSVTGENELIFSTFGNENHSAKNTNPNAASLPGILGSKTGFTDLAGGNLTVALDASFGRPIIIVVLGSSEEGRFRDVETLAKAVFADFYWSEKT